MRTRRAPSGPVPAVGEHHGGSFGVYMVHKQAKLRGRGAPAAADIFRGVSIYVNGRTHPTAAELRRLISAHGGRLDNYQTSDVTHMVVSNLPYAKLRLVVCVSCAARGARWHLTSFRSKSSRVAIVRPEWIVDSIAAGRRLPEQRYTLDRLQRPEARGMASFVSAHRLAGDDEAGRDGTTEDATAAATAAAATTAPAAATAAATAEGSIATGSVSADHAQQQHQRPRRNVGAERAPTSRAPGVADARHVDRGTAGDANVAPPRLRVAGTAADLLAQSILSSPPAHPRAPTPVQAPAAPTSVLASLKSAPLKRRGVYILPQLPVSPLRPHGPSLEEQYLPSARDMSEAQAEARVQLEPRGGALTALYPGQAAGPSSGQAVPSAVAAASSGQAVPSAVAAASSGQSVPSAVAAASSGQSVPSAVAADSPGQTVPPATPTAPPVPAAAAPEGAIAHDLLLPHNVRDGAGRGRPRPSGPTAVATAAEDPAFMQHYWQRSRLHFIGAFRAHVQSLVPLLLEQVGAEPDVVASGVLALAPPDPARRVVMHVDMDCFFASVALRTRPELRDVPVAVAHTGNGGSADGRRGGSSEVSSCNYPARVFGVRAGMFMGEARRLCPHLTVLPYDFAAIRDVSEQTYRVFLRYTHALEPVSCDEAFLDMSHYADPQAAARALRADILAATGCTASAGVGPNMLLARLATRRAKPDGQFVVAPEAVAELMADLELRQLPGVGRKLSARLAERGVTTCAEVAALSLRNLQSWVGDKTGLMLHDFAAGKDDRPIRTAAPRKPVGAEVNWGVRFRELHEALLFLDGLAAEVAQRLRASGHHARTVTLKLKKRKPGAGEALKHLGHGPCINLSRSSTLPAATQAAAVISREAARLFSQMAVPASEVRGIGIALSRLSAAERAGTIEGMLQQVEGQRVGQTERGLSERGAGQSEERAGQPEQQTGQSGPSKSEGQRLPCPRAPSECASAAVPPQAAAPLPDPGQPLPATARAAGTTATASAPARVRADRAGGSTARTADARASPTLPDPPSRMSHADLWPSLSQADPEVLRALPLALKRELERDDQRRKRRRLGGGEAPAAEAPADAAGARRRQMRVRDFVRPARGGSVPLAARASPSQAPDGRAGPAGGGGATAGSGGGEGVSSDAPGFAVPLAVLRAMGIGLDRWLRMTAAQQQRALESTDWSPGRQQWRQPSPTASSGAAVRAARESAEAHAASLTSEDVHDAVASSALGVEDGNAQTVSTASSGALWTPHTGFDPDRAANDIVQRLKATECPSRSDAEDVILVAAAWITERRLFDALQLRDSVARICDAKSRRPQSPSTDAWSLLRDHVRVAIGAVASIVEHGDVARLVN